jgi:hypothetical protein
MCICVRVVILFGRVVKGTKSTSLLEKENKIPIWKSTFEKGGAKIPIWKSTLEKVDEKKIDIKFI